jgi:hypothetical protein
MAKVFSELQPYWILYYKKVVIDDMPQQKSNHLLRVEFAL